MFPWLWFWAPQLHFPWSGDVAQRIAPETRWFFAGIPPSAGDAQIEQKAFSVASYGRQLGLITEVLIDLAAQVDPKSPQAGESLGRLRSIQAEIERIKVEEQGAKVLEIEAAIAALKRRGGSEYAELSRRVLPLLSDA